MPGYLQIRMASDPLDSFHYYTLESRQKDQ
jgi:hypothetical protein